MLKCHLQDQPGWLVTCGHFHQRLHLHTSNMTENLIWKFAWFVQRHPPDKQMLSNISNASDQYVQWGGVRNFLNHLFSTRQGFVHMEYLGHFTASKILHLNDFPPFHLGKWNWLVLFISPRNLFLFFHSLLVNFQCLFICLFVSSVWRGSSDHHYKMIEIYSVKNNVICDMKFGPETFRTLMQNDITLDYQLPSAVFSLLKVCIHA